MKKLIAILTFCCLLFNTQSANAQDKTETLNWLRSHLDTIVVQNNDSILPYTMTKTYTFYDDAFVVKTVKDFYKDTSLNGPAAFGKVWYKDIFTENDTAITRGIQSEEAEGKMFVYTIWAAHVYSIIGREDAPLPFWRTFNEPMGLDLYLPGDKALGIKAVQMLYRSASLLGAKERPRELIPDEDFGGD